MLNFNDGNNGHGRKNVTCKQTLNLPKRNREKDEGVNQLTIQQCMYHRINLSTVSDFLKSLSLLRQRATTIEAPNYPLLSNKPQHLRLWNKDSSFAATWTWALLSKEQGTKTQTTHLQMFPTFCCCLFFFRKETDNFCNYGNGKTKENACLSMVAPLSVFYM